MRITATYDADEVFRLLAKIFPLDVRLGEEGDDCRKVRLHPPKRYDMVPGEGVRIHTDAELFWPALVLKSGLRIPELEATVLPSVTHREGAWHLLFSIRIDNFDMKLLPDVVERAIAGEVTGALERSGVEVAWNYDNTMSVDIDLPHNVRPPRQFRMRADEATVMVSASGLVIEGPLHFSFVRLP